MSRALQHFGMPLSATSSTIRRLQSELSEITENPPPLCSASPKGDNIMEWVATIMGPPDSVYEKGVFFLDVVFPMEYPFKPPSVKFRTRIYHCNVNSKGVICLDVLKDSWSPLFTLAKVLLTIVSLMLDCNPNDPLVGAIGKLYLTDREEHDRVARIWTQKFAT